MCFSISNLLICDTSPDNEYYKQLAGETVFANGPDWTPLLVQPGNMWQWEDGNKPQMMLNVDIGLVRNLAGKLQGNGEATCAFNFSATETSRCPLAATLEQAGFYRNNNTAWLLEFKGALVIMLEKGLTGEPSTAPSESPSVSALPSNAPSNEPSASAGPSQQPSTTPSVSALPSNAPSNEPSVSIEPSNQPSTTPSLSLVPSSSPSNDPSASIDPSNQPSNRPSVSAVPSSAPSMEPSLILKTVPAILAVADTRIRQTITKNVTLAATYLRLGFHDCVPNGEAGGCDGCVNLFTNTANNGLLTAVNSLAPIVADLEDDLLGVSRADLWAFAALVAADVSQNNLIFSDTFKVGRENCETVGTCINDENSCATNGPDQTSDHPSNDLTTHQLIAFMNAHFGFDARETVALMGVHTLGRALPENSGFEGGSGWVVNNTHLGKFLRLSTRYYVLLDF